MEIIALIEYMYVFYHYIFFASVMCYTLCYILWTFIPLSVSLWNINDFADPVFNYVRLAGFISRANAFSLAKVYGSFCVFSPFFLCIGIVGLRFSD